MDLTPYQLDFILQKTGAKSATAEQSVQTLWSGYGEITRFALQGCDRNSLIVKHIAPPLNAHHPRGWNTNLSHERKLKSYQVEINWYRNWSKLCSKSSYVPQCFGITSKKGEILILLEDLDAIGFDSRFNTLNQENLQACLRWLAHFHACFMQHEPIGLWPVGTYWHLDTRPEEWDAMEDSPLKKAAKEINAKLNQCQFKTIVHGDAKVANFCFSSNDNSVAAVDFQYAGGGCGMKDVAYFLGSCLSGTECDLYQDDYLNYYFSSLKKALAKAGNGVDCTAIENEWRQLYPLAWADFNRFLLGWSPNHKKLNRHSSNMTQLALQQLQKSLSKK